MCRLRVAVYGHPDSGTDWGHRCGKSLKAVGLEKVGEGVWPACYFHSGLSRRSCVYVDAFELAGPTSSRGQGWALIAIDLELDTPQPLDLHLGCTHERKELQMGSSTVQVLFYTMEDFLTSSVELCVALFPAAPSMSSASPVRVASPCTPDAPVATPPPRALDTDKREGGFTGGDG